ncbi:MAG: Uma2 family endonuclease [Gemmataceae bacterium]|nr:Uma2 family endonuclease [Gemmataceae bacterium]
MAPSVPQTPTYAATYLADASIARYSVKRYQHLVEIGGLGPDDKVELLENLMVLKMPRDPIHDATIQQMVRPLLRVIPGGYDLRSQSAVALSDSQPEPDHAIVRGTARDYVARHPGPDDIALVIEVANTSLLRDQRDKARIYARASIPVYWIVNLDDRRVEVHEQPSGPVSSPAYNRITHFLPGQALPLPTGGSVAVDDLLP